MKNLLKIISLFLVIVFLNSCTTEKSPEEIDISSLEFLYTKDGKKLSLDPITHSITFEYNADGAKVPLSQETLSQEFLYTKSGKRMPMCTGRKTEDCSYCAWPCPRPEDMRPPAACAPPCIDQ